MGRKPFPVLGTDSSGEFKIDVSKLVESRLLLQANSGGGKSHTIRKLLEITDGHCPRIVIDVEGEFHTLREMFDFVLAGKGGDCPATVDNAALLATRLLELGASAVIDISELRVPQRELFVKRFLDSLVGAPQKLWQQLLVVVDEAQKFCPEGGAALTKDDDKRTCADAVIDLMTVGRKRGFCGVLATQRISGLNKSAAAECNNKLIGRAGLDIDIKRAGDELGLDKTGRAGLRRLMPGEFHAFGPAFRLGVTLFVVDPVKTTHPKAGHALKATPPRAQVKAALAKLADISQEAEQEAKTVDEMKTKIRELETALKAAKKGTPVAQKIVEHVIEKPALNKASITALERALKIGDKSSAKVASVAANLLDNINVVTKELAALRGEISRVIGGMVRQPTPVALKPTRKPNPKPERQSDNGEALPDGEAKILRALIQFEAGLKREAISVITGYKRSTRNAYISRLATRDYVEERGDLVVATDAGRTAIPDAEPLPAGAALRDYWRQKLPEGEQLVLKVLIDAYPDGVSRDDIGEQTGYKRSTRNAYISRLRTKQLVTGEDPVKASETLF